MVIGDASPEGVAVREFGVAPLDSPGTDLEDELPTPEDSVMIGGCPERVAIPELGVAPPTAECVAVADYRASLLEPMEALPMSPSLYPEPPVLDQPDPVPSAELRDVPLREADDRLTIDLFPSFLISPAQSYYEPVTSPITVDLYDDSGSLPPDSQAIMDQYIAADADLLLGDPSDLLSLPFLPVPVGDVLDHSGLPLLGSQGWCPWWYRRTYLRRAPLRWIGLLRGTLHGC